MALSKDLESHIEAAKSLRHAVITRIGEADAIGFVRKSARIPTETFGEITINVSAIDPQSPVILALPVERDFVPGKEHILIDNGGVISSQFLPETGSVVQIESPETSLVQQLTIEIAGNQRIN